MKKIKVNIVPDGKWWSVTIPEYRGIFTQGRTLYEVNKMVRDALELVRKDIPQIPSEYELDIVPNLKGASAKQIKEINTLRNQKQKIDSELSVKTNKLIKVLKEQKLKNEDIAYFLGITPQYVSVLLRKQREKV